MIEVIVEVQDIQHPENSYANPIATTIERDGVLYHYTLSRQDIDGTVIKTIAIYQV